MKKIIIVLMVAVGCLLPIVSSAESVDGPVAYESAPEDDYENVFETVFEKASQNLPEILTAATLALSVVLAYAFKKGLLPLMRGSLGALGDAVKSIKEKGDNDREALSALDKVVTGGFEVIEKAFREVSLQLEAMKEALSRAEERAGDRETLVKIIRGQIDMLYDVFMSSSLPHYQKEAVGERIAEMREAIGSDAEK